MCGILFMKERDMKHLTALVLLVGMTISFGAVACEGSNHNKHQSSTTTSTAPATPAK
jgi:hypothetical protein